MKCDKIGSVKIFSIIIYIYLIFVYFNKAVTYYDTYLLTYLLHGAESFLKS
jgi:hypothetical protein